MRRQHYPPVAIILFAISASATGQMPDPLTPDVDQYVRVKYDRSPSLPDGVAFLETLRLLNHYKATDDVRWAVEWIEDEMQFNETESRAFLAAAIEAFDSIERDISASTISLACEHGVASAYNRNVYSVLHQMDDARETIADQHYQEFSAQIGAEGAKRLQRWMDLQKGKIVHIKFDHEKADQLTGRNSTAMLVTICAGAES